MEGTCLYYVNVDWLMDPFATEAKEKERKAEEKVEKTTAKKDDVAKVSEKAVPILRS